MTNIFLWVNLPTQHWYDQTQMHFVFTRNGQYIWSRFLCSSKTYLKCTQSVSLVVYYKIFTGKKVVSPYGVSPYCLFPGREFFFSQTGLPLQKFQPISLLVTSKALSINNQSSQGKHMFKGGATGTVSNTTQHNNSSNPPPGRNPPPWKKSPHFVTICKMYSKRSQHMSCMCLQ